MKTKLSLAFMMLCFATLAFAQVERRNARNLTNMVVERDNLSTNLVLSETGVINVCDVNELTLKASVTGEYVERVQFDYSADGRNWQGTGTDRDGRDGYTAKMPLASLPDGTYIVEATAFYRGNRTSSARGEIVIFNGRAAPYWASPAALETEIGENNFSLEVTQDPNTSNWVSVTYDYSVDGIQFTEIATDNNGENGWSQNWDLNKTEPGGYIVRATVIDKAGNSTSTFRRVARIYESDFFAAVQVGAIQFKSFDQGNFKLGNQPQINANSEGEAALLVESLNGVFNYTVDNDSLPEPSVGKLRAKLFLDPLNEESTFSTEVQIDAGQNPSFNVDGLSAGSYRAVVLLIYNSNNSTHTLRSEVTYLVAGSDSGANFGDPAWATAQLDGLIGQTGGNGSASFSLKRDGVTVQAISNTVTQPGVKASLLGSGFARLGGATALSFLVINTSGSTFDDTLNFEAYSWTDFGDPIQNEVQTFPISLNPGESTNIQVIANGDYGQVGQFAGFTASFDSDTANVSGFGFAGINEDTDVLENISVEIGDDQVAFTPYEFEGKYEFKSGFPEYHWVKCKRVRVYPNGGDPDASYSTTVINRPGGTQVIPKKCPVLHAGIIGGPHSVRHTCISKDGTTKVYGSEHYVHKSIKKITIKPKPSSGGKRAKSETGGNEIVPTIEYECGATVIGLTGPGGEIKHTTGYSVTVNASVTSTVSGTIGKEGVASIGASVGVTAGVAVQMSATNEYSKKLGEGECGILKQRLCFKVWRGVIEIEFDDGTKISGDWEAKKLDSVGYKVIPATCQ